MEKLIKYLIRNLKHAGKRVLRRLSAYLPFLVALFVVQTMLFTLYITNDTDRTNRYEKIRESYDYDILIDNLTSSQCVAIENRLYVQSHASKRLFESYRSKESADVDGRWQIYVEMRDGSSNEDFLDYYIYQNSGVFHKETIDVSFTPLNEYRNDSTLSRAEPSVWLLLIIAVLSSAALCALYTVRIDQNRFEYGIYMSFGAGSKRLVSTSVFEMLIVSFLALIPSALFSIGLASLLYSQFGITPKVSAFMFLKVLVIDVLVTVAGTYLPMKMMSLRTPMSMIAGADNSNLVTPPRYTKFMTGKRFLEHYELMSVWRFRKYYLRLLLSATIFSAVFICGVYICNMNAASLDEDVLQYKISFREDVVSDRERLDILENIRDDILASGDTAYIYYAAEDYAGSSLSLMLMQRGLVRIQGDDVAVLDSVNNAFGDTDAGLERLINEGYDRATFKYVYKAYDRQMLCELKKRYEIDGDVYSVLNNDNTVILSEDALNVRKYSFEVGDTVFFARLIEEGESELEPEDEAYYMYADEVATSLLNTNRYEFVEYTVGAVIKNCPESEGYVSAVLSREDYAYLTGVSPIPTSASVYLESDASDTDVNSLADILHRVYRDYERVLSVEDTYAYLYRVIEKERSGYGFGITLSLLILAMTPIVWFYSQSLHYKKREKELLVLRAYGATDSLLRGIFKVSGVILSVLGFAFTMVFGLLSSYVIFKVMNEWIVALGFVGDVRYTFHISWWTLLLCLSISAVCGFLSCYVPYRKNSVKNKRNK